MPSEISVSTAPCFLLECWGSGLGISRYGERDLTIVDCPRMRAANFADPEE